MLRVKCLIGICSRNPRRQDLEASSGCFFLIYLFIYFLVSSNIKETE